jgi:hypothetical protein
MLSGRNCRGEIAVSSRRSYGDSALASTVLPCERIRVWIVREEAVVHSSEARAAHQLRTKNTLHADLSCDLARSRERLRAVTLVRLPPSTHTSIREPLRRFRSGRCLTSHWGGGYPTRPRGLRPNAEMKCRDCVTLFHSVDARSCNTLNSLKVFCGAEFAFGFLRECGRLRGTFFALLPEKRGYEQERKRACAAFFTSEKETSRAPREQGPPGPFHLGRVRFLLDFPTRGMGRSGQVVVSEKEVVNGDAAGDCSQPSTS